MIVQNEGTARCTDNFKYDTTVLEPVQTYRYLRITFNENTSMVLAQEILCKKAIKSYYAMQSILFSNKI